MKKIFLSFLLLIFSQLSFSQDIPNLKEIKKNVTDANSPFFYEKLVYQFNFNPGNMNAKEAEHLYYGKTYANYKVPFNNEQEISREALNDLIKAEKYGQAI